MIRQRQQRLKEVYEYLRRHYGIYTQKDFAVALGLTRPAVSSAMNGNESYLTDNLFKRICAAYQGVFNLNYLLHGEGELLTKHDTPINENLNTSPIDDSIEKTLSALRIAVSALDRELQNKDKQLADKDKIIKLQEERIADLERRLLQDEEIETLKKISFQQIVSEKKSDSERAHI